MNPSDYNYAHFPEDLDAPVFERFKTHMSVGDRAPDGELVDIADGSSVTLSELWKQGLLVMEFGSLT